MTPEQQSPVSAADSIFARVIAAITAWKAIMIVNLPGYAVSSSGCLTP